MALTFAQIKDSILSVAKTADVCSSYQDILLAATEQDIIDAGLSLAEWAYRANVITDALIAEFNQPNLNANKIYSTGVHALINPAGTIYVFGNATINLTLSGNNKCKIIAFSNSIINANLSNNAYLTSKIFNAKLTLVQTDNSVSCNEISESVTSSVQTSNNTVSHIKAYDNTILSLVSNNDSYIKLQGFFNSQTTGVQNDASIIDYMISQKSTFNGIAP